MNASPAIQRNDRVLERWVHVIGAFDAVTTVMRDRARRDAGRRTMHADSVALVKGNHTVVKVCCVRIGTVMADAEANRVVGNNAAFESRPTLVDGDADLGIG